MAFKEKKFLFSFFPLFLFNFWAKNQLAGLFPTFSGPWTLDKIGHWGFLMKMKGWNDGAHLYLLNLFSLTGTLFLLKSVSYEANSPRSTPLDSEGQDKYVGE